MTQIRSAIKRTALLKYKSQGFGLYVYQSYAGNETAAVYNHFNLMPMKSLDSKAIRVMLQKIGIFTIRLVVCLANGRHNTLISLFKIKRTI